MHWRIGAACNIFLSENLSLYFHFFVCERKFPLNILSMCEAAQKAFFSPFSSTSLCLVVMVSVMMMIVKPSDLF